MRQVGNYHETQAEIKALLGITDVQTVAAAPKPETPKVQVKPLTGSWAMDYLTNDRGLSTATLRKYEVRSHSRNSSHNSDFYAFKFVSPDGDYVMLKSVGIHKDDKGRKDIWSTAAYATLWGWPTVDDTADQITICEGEIDAMSLCDMGADMPVLSVPSGCSNMGWIENDYEALERFETIYLCFDNDEAGEKAANDVAKRLGITRCKRLRVPSPHNDLNDLLLAGDGFGPLYENAESYDPKTLKPVDGMAAELAEEIDRYQQENEHNPFLFPELKYRFRKGELTIVGGYPGHGKSQWLYQSCMHEMLNNDRRSCIASFEIPSKSMLFNMLWMHNGHMPKEESIQSDLTQFQDRLWFIEGVEGGTNSWESLHQDFLYAHRRYGVDLFVIDALMHIAAKDDWSGQERIAKDAAKFAIDNDVTVLLVCHADAKKAGSGQVPELEDVLGGQGIGAAAHAAVMIWRNKAKEKAIEAGEDVSDEMPDGRMYVPKQRANGVTIYRDLWFDTKRRTFSLEPKPNLGVDLPF
jgi:twinkle protein